MCIAALPECMPVERVCLMPGLPGVLDHLGLELHVVVSCYTGARNLKSALQACIDLTEPSTQPQVIKK